MSSTQKTDQPSPHASETGKFSDRPSSSRAKPSQDDGNNDSDDLDTQKEDSKDDTYDDDDDEGTTTDAENKSENDENGAFAPIKSPAQPNEDNNNRLQLSRSIERSWSLNDGYSCHTGDEEAGEKIDEEAKVTGAEEPPEFVVGFDENDPMNPRNMSTPRRWLAVIICSLGSLCV